jgi:hypothetical protein
MESDYSGDKENRLRPPWSITSPEVSFHPWNKKNLPSFIYIRVSQR